MKAKTLVYLSIAVLLSIIVISATSSSSLSSRQQQILDKKNTTTVDLGLISLDSIRMDIVEGDLNRIKRTILRMDIDKAENQVELLKQTFNKSCSLNCK